MTAKLIAVNGPLTGQRFALEDEVISIGREKENLLVVEDDSISSMHAVLLRDGDEWKVRDRGSTNGTRVNGREVVEGPVCDGDELELGMVLFRFECPREAAPAPPLCAAPTAAAPSVSVPLFTPPAAPPSPPQAATTDARGTKLRRGPVRGRLNESQIDAILHWTRPQPLFLALAVAALAATVAALCAYLQVVL